MEREVERAVLDRLIATDNPKQGEWTSLQHIKLPLVPRYEVGDVESALNSLEQSNTIESQDGEYRILPGSRRMTHPGEVSEPGKIK